MDGKAGTMRESAVHNTTGRHGPAPDTAGTAPAAPRLRPPAHPVDPRAITWWTWQAVLTVLGFLACVAGLELWLWKKTPLPLSVGVIALSLLLSVAYVLIVPSWRFRVHRWETTGEAVYTASGWLWQVWRVAPMSRIQTVDTARGPLQQMLGLATVVVTTASAAGPVRIHGLSHDLAKEVVDHLTATTQATQGADGDAT